MNSISRILFSAISLFNEMKNKIVTPRACTVFSCLAAVCLICCRIEAAQTNQDTGDFVEDKASGKGTTAFSNGDIYEEDLVDGTLNGKGTYTWSNGNQYVGDFVDGKKSGKGTFTYPNGDKYEGDFVDDKRTGYGTFTFSNGDKYEGAFVDGKLTGKRTLTFANGNSTWRPMTNKQEKEL